MRETLKLVDVYLQKPKLHQLRYLGRKFLYLIVVRIYLPQRIYFCQHYREVLHAIAVESQNLKTFQLFKLRRKLFYFVLTNAEDFERKTAETAWKSCEIIAETVNSFQLFEFYQSINISELVEINIDQFQIDEFKWNKVEMSQTVI